MPPTESQILTTHLTLPAELPTIISLQDFTNFFPKSVRGNPQIKSLYRDLQHQRSLTIDRVKQNIEAEVKASVRTRKELVRLKRDEQRMDVDDEVEIERAVRSTTWSI
jgi:centromere-localized protein 2